MIADQLAGRSPADGRVRVAAAAGQPADATTAEYVLLWCSCALRVAENAALEHAIWEANRNGLPVLAVFALTADYPGANERSFAFLLEGLHDYQKQLRRERQVHLLLLQGQPVQVVSAMAARAALVVTDVGYTRLSRQWHRELAAQCPCPFHAVESEVVVPVEMASHREEPAAATLRPKLRRHFKRFLRPVDTVTPLHSSLDGPSQPLPLAFPPLDLGPVDDSSGRGISAALTTIGLGLDRTVPRVEGFRGGSSEAEARLQIFLRSKLPGFATYRKDPNARYQSHLAPYLHFGFISPVRAALAVMSAAGIEVPGGSTGNGSDNQQQDNAATLPSWPCAPRAESAAASAAVATGGAGGLTAEDVEAFLDELIVRRELARNLVWYNPQYDTVNCLRSTAGWALQTLRDHMVDSRAQLFSFEQMEAGQVCCILWVFARATIYCIQVLHKTEPVVNTNSLTGTCVILLMTYLHGSACACVRLCSDQ